MQVTLKCKVSLSKKMRNLLQNGGSVVLTVDSINSGKGEGHLVLTDDGPSQDITDLMGNETSIMLTPMNVVENERSTPVANIYQNVGQPNPGVSQVFNQQPQYQQHSPQYQQPPQGYQQRNAVDRLAATQPPDHGQNNRAYYTQEELQVPREFQQPQQGQPQQGQPQQGQPQNMGFMNYIKNYQELFSAVSESKNKIADIQVESIQEGDSMGVRRQKAILQEQKDMQESIGCDAYVVNEKCASLTINDIGLDLPLNMPKNLGNISAKKLASSRQLWDLFRQNYIRLVSPNEADHLMKNAGTMNRTYVPELEIYDSHYDAGDAMHESQSHGRYAETQMIDLESSHLEGPSEELRMLRMAGGDNRSEVGGGVQSLTGNTRRSFHGSSSEMENASLDDIYSGDEWSIDNRHVGRESRRNKAGLKTVASRHSPRRY